MERRRKQAYRYLLYHAMLDIRPITWMSLRFLNPFCWRKTAAQIRRAGVIADWLHNLAFFSAIDFDRFDEDLFWDDFRQCENRHPEFQLTIYKDVFERELNNDGHIKAQ